MKRVLKQVFQTLITDRAPGQPDATDLGAVMDAAKQMSLALPYRDTMIVVVEMGSEFDVHTGECARRQYLYYPFRETADFRRIVCLKAAYRNGRRIDTEYGAGDQCTVPLKLGWGPNAPTLVWSKGRRSRADRDNRN
jgi:hypothetical protein